MPRQTIRLRGRQRWERFKYCSSCDEGFAERFTFCPDCGGSLQAFEMNPVTGESVAIEPTAGPEAFETAPAIEEVPAFEARGLEPEPVSFSEAEEHVEAIDEPVEDETPVTIATNFPEPVYQRSRCTRIRPIPSPAPNPSQVKRVIRYGHRGEERQAA